jgi:hypothetical protein
MKRTTFVGIYVALLVVWAAAAHNLLFASAVGQGEVAVIGTIRLTQPVMADGKVLPPGTYQVRLTSDQPAAAVGESPGGERWVEFVKNGTVAGREVATVVSANEITAIAKGPQPKANSSRVEVLKGGDYVRVWINRGGMNYIINLPPAR